jgi:hypothetical protein
VFDAVRLVRGEGLVVKTKASDMAAARHRIEAGDVGTVTFADAYHWLGWKRGDVRRAIFAGAGRRAQKSWRHGQHPLPAPRAHATLE